MLSWRGEGKEEEKSTTKWVKVLNSGHPTVFAETEKQKNVLAK